MSLQRSILALAAFTALSLPATAFAADSTGQKGFIQAIEINHSTSDTYLQYHGRIVVKTGSSTAEYRWGGTSCSSMTLPTELVTILWDAFHSRKITNVTPRFQDGQGSNKCLVGFSFDNRKDTADPDVPKDPPTLN